jgi:hypothetical protein
MPIPYAEPALVALAAYGVNGATPTTGPGSGAGAYKSSAQGINLSPVVLTGTNQTLGTVTFTAASGQKMIVSGSVAANVTSSGETGQLVCEIDVDGSPLIASFGQSYPDDATLTSAAQTLLSALTAGSHTVTLKAKATGDGALTVPAAGGVLVVQVVSA